MRTTTIYLTATCLLTAMTMGCAHNAPPPMAPPPVHHPTPAYHFVVCQQTRVKVGKMYINIPKDNSLEIVGVNSTPPTSYLDLEGVEFSYKECR